MVFGDRNSDMSQIAVNANQIPNDSIDCGIRSLGWCSGPKCQSYARLRTFMTVLGCAGLLQGACETYFRISAKQAALENGYNTLIVEWLLVSSGIFQAIFAIGYAHWSQKMNSISWLSGTIILQGLVSIIAVIPSILNFSDGVVPATTQQVAADLCSSSFNAKQSSTLTQEESQLITLVLLFVLQLALGLGSVAFYTIGIIYVDDNSLSIDSPAAIAVVLGTKISGLQLGSALILGIGATSIGWWLGWAILGLLVFVSGLLLGLFPQRLPKTMLHQAAQRIIEESRSRQFGGQFSTYIDDTNFGPSVKRLFSNKLLMFNLMSIMFIQAACANYMLQEESYLQSRFFMPFSEQDGLMQEWNTRFVSYFLKPPVASVGMLIGGLVIAKLKLSGRKITGINITLGVHLLGIFIAYIFIKCDVGQIAGITNGKLTQPYCSYQCVCEPTAFLPICPENSTVTYFSPCYAGCTRQTNINNIELYEGCSCGIFPGLNPAQGIRATEGSCSAKKCSANLIVFQVLSLSAAGILGVATIGKIIITLRSVLPQDKALALAMEVTFFGLFAYIPCHLAYDVVTRTTCIYWAPEYARCLLRETPLHGNILNILSASLILVGIFFDILVFIFVKDINIYNCKVTDVNYTPSLYSPIPHDEHELTTPVQNLTQAPPPSSLQTAVGGSPTTTTTSGSPLPRRKSQPIRKAPEPGAITVFRNPSSLTNSSAGEASIAPTTDITYAQVVFPPDKRKPNDGTVSPKRMAVRADVPLHHLSAQDVRAQLSSLKSFNSVESKHDDNASTAATPLTVDTAEAVAVKATEPIETDLDDQRPQSPETNF